MLDIDQDCSDEFETEHRSVDSNIGLALKIAINNPDIKGMDLINIIRLAAGFSTLLQNGTSGEDHHNYKIHSVENEDVSEEDEINELIGEL